MRNVLPIPSNVGAVILAAGKGTRMHSDMPKVLLRMLEEPMLGYVYDALAPLCGERIWTVIGHGGELVRSTFPAQEPRFVVQEEQLGTGHALLQALPHLLAAGQERVLVVNGDTPLLSPEAMEELLVLALDEDADVAFITLTLPDPGSFGRVLRQNEKVTAIVEAKDFNTEQHGPEPKEINAGVYCLKTSEVSALLPLLTNDNRSGEFYLTDIVSLAMERGLKLLGQNRGDDPALLGINTPHELVQAEDRLRQRLVETHSATGVFIHNHASVRIGPGVRIARGVDITGPCEIYGCSDIKPGARIASHCRLQDALVETGAQIHSFCHIQKAQIGPDCIVGPFARLRPGAILEEESHVGNFVEIKKTRLGKKAKANHLAYLGDTNVGESANIGAGVITCNYDGKNKHRTLIGKQAFIGSNAALVAPVEIGANTLVGAGSVITKDVPDDHLALTRPPLRMAHHKKTPRN